MVGYNYLNINIIYTSLISLDVNYPRLECKSSNNLDSY